MILLKNTTIASAIIVVAQLAGRHHGGFVDAHGYLKSPRSRNYVASIDPVWFGGTANDPAPENCPHCLNIGGTEARCGKVGDHNYDYPPNALGVGIVPPNVQECYEEGSTIDIVSVLTAHHKGHFEVKACPIAPGEVASQACFDQHPLTFEKDMLYGAVKHNEFPGRAYIPLKENTVLEPNGEYTYHHQFKLPEGLRGDLILLQWYYLTANSCKAEGYDSYDWPPGFYPGDLPVCEVIPPDGRGVPEQFWNCAEVEIKVSNGCGTSSPAATLSPTTSPIKLPTLSPLAANETTTTSTSSVNTVATTTMATSTNTPDPNCPAATQQCGPSTSCADIGFPGMCCSKWGWCGTSSDHCGECCQSGNCSNSPPSPTPPTDGTTPRPTPSPTPPTQSGFEYDANHGEDSRLIAYVGNWQSCPTDEQVDAYSHIVIAFAVSYVWSPAKNACDTQCNIASEVPICNNVNNQALVDKWRSKGKKVILSFGGAGMGGSWSGDQNNCWDYCFGEDKTEALANSLVAIVDNQKFDGIDIDYEYCYDVEGKQAGRCSQRSADYSDLKAQTFLNDLTSKMRTKLDALQATNGYNRGRYEVTHAPMDSDLTLDSEYFKILQARRADLDFLMPQFYNGLTRPAVDGIEGSGAGQFRAIDMYSDLANVMFEGEPQKVVFGHCINDCSGTGSNTNAAQAVKITQDLKEINEGEFECNGGAFFWVAEHDTNGAWSDAVVGEVSKTAGCSSGGVASQDPTSSPVAIETAVPTATPSASPTSSPIKLTQSPSKSPLSTPVPTSSPMEFVSPTLSPIKAPSSSPVTEGPTKSPSKSPTKSPITLKPTGSPVTTTTSSTINTGATVTTSSTTTTPVTITCTAIPQSELPADKFETTDEQCSVCADGYEWWPCNYDLCRCSGDAPTPPPTPACTAQTATCGLNKPCANGACCSKWGYCGTTEAYCGECCQNGPCFN